MGTIVRIEVAKEELGRALDPAMAAEFTRLFKGLGFKVRYARSGGLPVGFDECSLACQ